MNNGFYLIYTDPKNGIENTSRVYQTKAELDDNYEFLVRSGYDVRIKVAE